MTVSVGCSAVFVESLRAAWHMVNGKCSKCSEESLGSWGAGAAAAAAACEIVVKTPTGIFSRQTAVDSSSVEPAESSVISTAHKTIAMQACSKL